jgi:hypothetical protein
MLMYFFVRLIKLQIFDLSNQILFFEGAYISLLLKGSLFILTLAQPRRDVTII